MPIDRDALLAEMGLTPIWKMRNSGKPSNPEAIPVAHTPAQAAREQPAIPVAPSAEARELRIRGMDWVELKQAVSACQACPLHSSRARAVFGVGDEKADWLLVGEAPGAEEDRQGEPFVGQAGRLLDNMLAAIGLKRGQNVYIANVLKCRPPGNRNPEPEEVAQCAPHLSRQIELIQPKLILGLGRFAAQTLLNSDASIASLRGRTHRYAGVPLIITYHPAYLLRNLPDKSKAWADLLLAKRTMAEAASQGVRG